MTPSRSHNIVFNVIYDQSYLKTIGEHFAVDGDFISAHPYGSGHINDTFLGAWRASRGRVNYIIQRINHDVFEDPPGLMENIMRVTSHLRKKISCLPGADPDRESLTVVPARNGRPFYLDPDGHYWRVYVFITRAKTYDVCTRISHAGEAARAIGRFQRFISDLPGKRLHDSIPFFHHSPRRFQALEQAVESDACNRCASAADAIKFCMDRRELTTEITRLLEGGVLPEKIAHNDAKFNNIMIDDQTGRAVCVIDLDTVMPGSALYDFGDMVRTIAQTASEDERDLSKAGTDLAMFEALVEGYIDGVGGVLAQSEIDNLAVAGRVVTFTIGIRFLTDYLSGDLYFKTARENHNLDRAKVQFRMLECMERQESAMREIVRRYRR